MERALPRTSLQGSALVGCLTQLELLEAAGPRPSFVEGMGQWLGWTHAIRLAAALQASCPAPRSSTHAADAPAPPVERELQRVRMALERAIDELAGSPAPATRRRAGLAPLRAGAVAGTDFTAHRRRFIDMQQSHEAAVAMLRTQARRAVATQPALGTLASLDAVMADVVTPREQAVLATLPALLQSRFEQLQRAEPPIAASPAAEPPWLDLFRQDMQRLLRAELELRLQPVLGLIDALRSPPQDHDE